jgi:hypothetical protein
MGFLDEFQRSPNFAQGRAEAEDDIAAGRLGQRAFGKLVPWWEDVAQLLQERYQIGLEVVGWCITESSVAARAMGYNERMDEEIAGRFGSDVVAATWREVERKRKKRRKG